MPSLVIELQQEAMNPQVKVSDLLRKALVVSAKLSLEEFGKWVELELHGYQKGESIPLYRNVKGLIKYRNPFQGWQPLMFKNPKEAEVLSHREIKQPIGELESLLLGKDDWLQVPFPHEISSKLARATMGIPPTLLVDRSRVHGILDAARNAILEWSLKLEKNNILGDGMTFSNEEKVKASSATYHIQNFTGVMGTVHSNVLQIGDFNSIHAELKRLGIPQSDRNKLERIMDQAKDARGAEKSSLVKQGLTWVLEHGPQLGALAETLRQWFQSQ